MKRIKRQNSFIGISQNLVFEIEVFASKAEYGNEPEP
jgi:hypothetical protein